VLADAVLDDAMLDVALVCEDATLVLLAPPAPPVPS